MSHKAARAPLNACASYLLGRMRLRASQLQGPHTQCRTRQCTWQWA